MLPYQVVERNLRHSMRFFAGASENGDVVETSGVMMVCSGVDFAVFNAALLAEPVSGGRGEIDNRITVAENHFRERGLRWSYWVCEDLLDGWSRVRARGAFTGHRLRVIAEHPGMIAERLRPAGRSLPPLEIRRVRDGATRLDFCQVTAAAFDLPLPVARRVYDSERVWRGDMIAYVGYREGAAVTTAATVSAAGAVGVYSVATLPEHQGRGYAEAVMRYALEQARESTGIDCSVLQSTRAGLSLYRRMGYRPVTRITLYVSG